MSILADKYPWSKWRKHIALWSDPELRTYLPETAKLERRSLMDYVKRHPIVFVKPCIGGGGRGVMKLSAGSKAGMILVESRGLRQEVLQNKLYAYIRSRTSGRSCIVQQGIELLGIRGRPIDFRVLLLRDRNKWVPMGIMGKLADRDQIVTNHCLGGSALTLPEALARTIQMSPEQALDQEKRMKQLALRIAKTMEGWFPLLTELGLDIGMDTEKRLWLIEANSRPQYKLFLNHENPKLYHRIDQLIRELRRRNGGLTLPKKGSSRSG